MRQASPSTQTAIWALFLISFFGFFGEWFQVQRHARQHQQQPEVSLNGDRF